MFLALRDLRAARGRFALMGGTVTLVTVLLVLLSGLADGLVDDGVSGLDELRATHLAFTEGAEATFSRSTVTAADAAALARDGVEATLLGVTFVNARGPGDVAVDLALFGVDPAGFLAPDGLDEAAIGADAVAVVDTALADDGLAVGDRIRVTGAGDLELELAGFAPTGSYGHVAIAYVPLSTWRLATYGDADRDTASAVALDVAGEAPAAGGLEVLTREEAYAGSPGFTAEQSTLQLIRWFLYVISALVVGAFFTVWTIQRTRDIGVLKALGAGTGYVLRDALVQAVVVLGLAAAVGVALGLLVGGWLAAGPAPFAFRPASVAGGVVLLVAFAMAGAAVALRRITRVDPLLALGADR